MMHVEKENLMKTRPHPFKRALALLLTLTSLLSLLTVGTTASSIEDGSRTASMTLGHGQFYLKTTVGTSLGAWSYTYTTDDGLTGPGYCIGHGLHFTSRTLPIEGKYTSSPQTAGVYANGYPQHSLDTFLWLYLNDNPILSGLTEGEYAYATQLAVWASLGQLGIEGTQFTSGREKIAQPTGDTQQMRVFRAVQLLLAVGATWQRIPQTGMYIRLEERELGGNLSIPADMTLDFAANNERYGFKREVIAGKSYYTHEYIFASATSTYYDNYCIELWTDGAPAGTIFTDLNNVELSRGAYHETATWTLPTENHDTALNENGFEYVGTAKLCIPVDTVPNSGEITIRCASFVMQYNIFLAKNEVSTEQSYIIADPSKTALSADAVLNWGSPITETGKLEVLKVDGSGNPLAGAVFTLSGSDGSSLTGTTDANGKIKWEMLSPLYTYTLTETTPPAGYGVAAPVNVEIKAARTNYVTVRDTVSKQLTVHKQDAQNGYSLVGATIAFEQIDGDFYTTRSTDHAGNIQLDADALPIGSYKVYEVSAPEGYETDSTPQTVNWDGLRDVTLTFTNVRKPTLTIYKCDEGNHRSLPYAMFEVYKNGQLITTVETNENGLAYVPGVTTGYYTVKETAAPAGYVLDGTEHSVYVNNYDPATTDDPRIVITNAAKPRLRILKYDAQTSRPLSDTTFEVYHDTTLLGEYTTNANGEIFLYDLAPGTYLVKEIAAPNTHVVNSTPQEIELEAGAADTYNLVFLNLVKPGIHLTKLDSQAMQPLVNARFRITEIGGTFSQEYRTDANGEIDLTQLTPASYTVEELAAPDGYLIDDASRTIKIEGGENAVFVFTDTRKPSFNLVKLDSLTGNRLPGATFRIAKIEDGTRYLDRVTDTNGEIQIENLDPGVYSMQEIDAPSGYVKNDTEYQVELFAGQTSRLVVTNQEKPDLKIAKRDADTGAVLSGAVFTVKKVDSSTLTTKTTDANGEILLRHLDPGVYQITEKTPPTGYLSAEKPTQLITLVPDKTGEVVFENHIKPSLTVRKIDSITGDGVQGAKFHIAYASNQTFTGELNDLGYYYSDENGQFSISGLRDGWYKVTEVTPPTGYAPNAEPQEFYLTAGMSKTATFENAPLSALVVFKYDSVTGEAVQNAVFQVKYLSGTSGTGGTVIGTYKTSANGSFTVTGLEAGAYVIEELASDSGHIIDTAPQTAFISGNPQAVVQLYFGNTPKGSLLIKKIDSANHAPLSDVQFLVTDSTGTLIGNNNGYFTTDSAGTILIDGIATGTTLIVKETAAKDGYVLDDTPQTAYIKAGQTVTLEFRNAPKGGLIIRKHDSVTGAPLGGAVFRVTTSDGRYADNYGGYVSSNGLYTTAANGQIQLYDLTPGTYVVTEVKAPAGYVLNSQPQTVVVNAADTQTLTFTNPPKGALIVQKYDSITKEPLAGAQFKITTSGGELVPGNEGLTSSNGLYTTDAKGQIMLPKLSPDTYVVTEVKAPDNYKLDAAPQTVRVNEADTQTVSFYDEPLCTLTLLKRDANTKKPLANAEFSVKYSDGTAVGANNERYTTGKDGTVIVSGLKPNATVVVAEVKAPTGYIKEPSPKTTVVRSGAANSLAFDNEPTTTLIIRKFIAGTENEPLSGVAFRVVDGSGAAVGSDDGVYYTDKAGEIVLDGLEPGMTVTAREVKTVDGYVLDGTPQDILIKAGTVQQLTFWNARQGALVIRKLDSITKTSLAGAEFSVRYADGRVVDNAGGKLSSNGIYTTNRHGESGITGLTGTVVVTEDKAPDGYLMDTNSRTQTVTVNADDTQTLVFYNTPIGGLTITKSDEDTGERISGVKFEVRKQNGEIVGQYTTDRNGVIRLPQLTKGWYVVTELKAASGYQLDPTPQSVEVKDGQTATLELTNERYSAITIHKTDAVTGEGIYGVTFMVYNSAKRPVEQLVTDQDGYARTETQLLSGRYYVREMQAADGYLTDTEYKTVTLRTGKDSTIKWENTPITGQIQVQKYAAEYNAVTGTAPGTPLSGAVYEIVDIRTGKVVDNIATDARGVAASKPLPLKRYQVKEVTAPTYWQVDATAYDATLEFAGQIVKISSYDKPAQLGVTLNKTGLKEVLAGNKMTYTFTVANTSNVSLSGFYFHDKLPYDVTGASALTTGTYSARLNYRILYKTNLNDYRVLASNLLSTNNYAFQLTGLPLMAGEVVTDVYYDFGTVPAGFQSVAKPTLTVSVSPTAVNGYQVINRADAGGLYAGTWQTANASWITIVRNLTPATPKTLPKTGY